METEYILLNRQSVSPGAMVWISVRRFLAGFGREEEEEYVGMGCGAVVQELNAVISVIKKRQCNTQTIRRGDFADLRILYCIS